MGHGSDWYRSLARPLLFALPPEASHRLAHRLLGLPLPWERLGGVEADPSLEVTLARLRLTNPVGLAAGFGKTGGREDAGARLGQVRRTAPRLASIADEDLADVLETHALLEPHVDAIELNASCPNVSWGRDRDNEAHLAELLRELGTRRTKPIFVKLPPFRSAVEREVVLALARIARQGGADALTCSNSLPVTEPRLAAGSGGLSGRELLEGTVENVAAMRAAIDGELPINACGGVAAAADAIACIEAGATTLQLYTGLVYGGPGLVGDLAAGLTRAVRDRPGGLAGMVGVGPSPGRGGEVGWRNRRSRSTPALVRPRAVPSAWSRSGNASATLWRSTVWTSRSARASSSRCWGPPDRARPPARA